MSEHIDSGSVAHAVSDQSGLGDIIELSLAPGGTWQQNNLTAITGTPPAAATFSGDFAVAGAPFAYVAPGGSGRVVYRDGEFSGNGDVIELSLDPDGAAWLHDNLTLITGAPRVVRGPTALVTPGGVSRVLYQDSNVAITELWRTQAGTWQHDSLTAITGAPPAARDAPFAYVTPDNATRVLYNDGNGDLIEMYLPLGETWQHDNLTASIGAPQIAYGPVAYVTPDLAARVFYQAFSGDIIELSLTSDAGTWQQANLTAITRAPQISGDLFAYVGPDGLARVLYPANNSHIVELRLDPDGWVQSDLTISVNNPPAPLASTTVFAYVGPDGLARVLYPSDNSHIVELRLDPDGWVQSDLTISVNNPPAPLVASSLFAYVTPDKVARVYYSSTPS